MKHHLNILLSFLAAATLAACGGGGGESGGGSAPVLISAQAGAAVTVAANGGASIEGSASSTRYPITSMKWQVQAVDPNASPVVITNGDCATAVKQDTPGVNNGGQAFTSSKWTCSVGLKAGAPTQKQDYTVVLTASDSNGSTTSTTTKLTVNAATTGSGGPVTVTAGDPQEVLSGATLTLNCLAAGGTTATGRYSWQWVQTSAPDVPLTIANAYAQTTSVVVPAVATPTSVTLECRATDDAATTGVASKIVRLMPSTSQSQPVLIASAGQAQVAAPGTSIQLNASGTQWFDAQGKPVLGPLVNYQWIQSGGPTVSLLSDTSAKASFDIPASITERTTFEFTLTASSTEPATGAPVRSTAKMAVVSDPAAALNLTLLSPAVSAARGQAVTLWALTGASTGTTVYYSWTQVSGPAVAVGGGATASAGFVVPMDATIGTTYVFRVAAGYKPINAAYPGITSQDMVVTVTR